MNEQFSNLVNTTRIIYNEVDTNGKDLKTAMFVNQSRLTPLDAGYCYIRMTAEQSVSGGPVSFV